MIKQYFFISLLALSSLNAQTQTVNDLKFGPQKETTGQRLDDIVAVVGNDIITRRELSRIPAKNRKARLQQLIMRKLLLQEAQKYNITVNDTALNIAINQKGKKSTHRTRNKAREDLAIAQLQQQVVNSLVKISDREVAAIVDKQLQKVSDRVRLVDVLVKVPQSADPKQLRQAQVKTQEIIKKLKNQSPQAVASGYPDVFFNDLGWVELSKIPTKFSKVLLDTPNNQYTQPIVDRDGIHLLKILDRKAKSHAAKTRSVPETRAAHILIKNSQTAKKTINNIYQKLRKGADFAELAIAYSQDTGSGASGGDLNWVLPGQMVPGFEKMMNKTAIGKFSRPFKTQFGYHIVQVKARRQAQTSSRTALERKARQAIFEKKANEEWELWLARLRDEAHVEIRQ